MTLNSSPVSVERSPVEHVLAYSAVDAKCTCIVTYDRDDFHFAETEVLDAEEFLLKYAVKKK